MRNTFLALWDGSPCDARSAPCDAGSPPHGMRMISGRGQVRSRWDVCEVPALLDTFLANPCEVPRDAGSGPRDAGSGPRVSM